MTYVLNKALKMKKPGDPDLYSPCQPCEHKCNEGCIEKGCKNCKQVRVDCTQCTRNKPCKLLKTGIAGGPSIIFCGYEKVGKSQIRSHKYPDLKTCARVVGFDANSLYPYCPGQEMSCGKKEYVEIRNPQDPRVIRDLCVLMGKLFGFLQAHIHV